MAPPSTRLPSVNPPRKPFGKQKIIARVLAALVLVVAVFFFRSQSGEVMGGPCRQDGDCRGLFGARCIREAQSYCSHTCQSTKDCEPGYECGRLHLTDVKSGKSEQLSACVHATARYELTVPEEEAADAGEVRITAPATDAGG